MTLVGQGPPYPYGTGPLTPARRYEVLREGPWKASAPRRAGSTGAIVRGDGRVMALGWIEPPARAKAPPLGRWLVEESNVSGSQWRVLQLPEGLSSTEGAPGSSCGRNAPAAVCRLLVVGGKTLYGADLLSGRARYWLE